MAVLEKRLAIRSSSILLFLLFSRTSWWKWRRLTAELYETDHGPGVSLFGETIIKLIASRHDRRSSDVRITWSLLGTPKDETTETRNATADVYSYNRSWRAGNRSHSGTITKRQWSSEKGRKKKYADDKTRGQCGRRKGELWILSCLLIDRKTS